MKVAKSMGRPPERPGLDLPPPTYGRVPPRLVPMLIGKRSSYNICQVISPLHLE
jgi:hypothetical protein